jgi:polyferredoxin
VYDVLADFVLLLHFGVVLFVIGGLAVVPIGNARDWRWVSSWTFRLLHLLAIGVVFVQAWLGATCPLTTLESWLRAKSGGSGYEIGFIQHWVHSVLFYEAPTRVFTIVYTAFGSLVVAAWWRYPPASTLRPGKAEFPNHAGSAATRRDA